MPKTIKNGDNVIVKQTGDKAKVTSIENGRYQLDIHPDFLYWHYEIIAVKNKPAVKNKTPINKFSPLRQTLNKIYQAVKTDFLKSNTKCMALFSGCNEKATQVHHKYKRTGYWLIMSKLFFPICDNCHKHATKHSKEAIDKGVSLSRHINMEYDFNHKEMDLIRKYNLKIPDNTNKYTH